GHGHQLPLVHGREFCLAPASHNAHSPVTHADPLGVRPERRDFAGELEPRDVLRRPGRSGIAAQTLVHVSPVDARGTNADEHLALARLGVRMPLDHEPLIADGDRPHYCLSSSATTSMCGVWGNMSTGLTRLSLYPPPCSSWAAFGASVVGLQET